MLLSQEAGANSWQRLKYHFKGACTRELRGADVCVVSLSFGALAINDVVAAALTVAFCEIVSSLYYGAPKSTLKLLFLQCFKIGIICALIADAFKLGGCDLLHCARLVL